MQNRKSVHIQKRYNQVTSDFKEGKKKCLDKRENCPFLFARKQSKHASIGFVYKFREGGNF